ncbi:alpha/beta hydrolase [Mangrovibacterium lignilyticum]|uniref:hypothetical protein n=1 Tax=Mangrovibacterium lignilyticum TaxID=2668052 RepID=UPI0013D8530A|nr:hypothetical protein [Mangrovibacterium lignilyticum]
MKTKNRLCEKIFSLCLILIASLFLNSCQDEFIEPENELSATLKNGTVQVEMTGMLPDGALYEIALPETWNVLPQRVLIVYAHGYVDPDQPIALPNDQIEGIPIKELILNNQPLPLGYATTSYRSNGLVVLDAIDDIKQLHSVIYAFFGQPTAEYLPPNALVLVGVSEGGLITVLTIEQNPDLFQAAIATCCPIGNFNNQLQYYGDAHVLFKYFFGPSFNDINLGSPKGVSKHTMEAWNDGSLTAALVEALQNDYLYNNGNNIRQFLACARIPVNMQEESPEDVIRSILEVLRFPVKATNDAIERLSGNPFNNKYPMREYQGSDNDRKLNLTVERVFRKTYDMAMANVNNYETTGFLTTPLLTMHTEFDHVSTYQHQIDYALKVQANSPFPELLVQFPVLGRYGHCAFTQEEVKQALDLLLAGMPL